MENDLFHQDTTEPKQKEYMTVGEYLFSLRAQSFNQTLNSIFESIHSNSELLSNINKDEAIKRLNFIIQSCIHSEQENFLSYILMCLQNDQFITKELITILNGIPHERFDKNNQIRSCLLKYAINPGSLYRFSTQTLVSNFFFESSFIKSLIFQMRDIFNQFLTEFKQQIDDFRLQTQNAISQNLYKTIDTERTKSQENLQKIVNLNYETISNRDNANRIQNDQSSLLQELSSTKNELKNANDQITKLKLQLSQKENFLEILNINSIMNYILEEKTNNNEFQVVQKEVLQLREKLRDYYQLKIELEDTRKLLDSVMQQKQEFEDEISQFDQQKTENSQKIRSLKKQLEEKDSQLKEATNQLEKMSEIYQNKNQIIEALKIKLQELNHNYNSIKQAIDSEKEKQSTGPKNSLCSSDNLFSQTSSQNKTSQEYSESIEQNMDHSIQHSNIEYQNSNQVLEDKDRQIRSLENDKKNLSERLVKKKAKILQMKNRLDDLTSEQGENLNQIKKQSIINNNYDIQINNYKSKLQKLTVNLNQANQTNSQLEEKLIQYQKNIEQLKNQIFEQQNQIVKQDQLSQEKEKENRNLKKEIEKIRKISNIEFKFGKPVIFDSQKIDSQDNKNSNQIATSFEKTIKLKEEELKALSADLTKTQKALLNIQTEKSNTEIKYANEIAQAQVEIRRLQRQKDEYQNTIKILSKEKNDSIKMFNSLILKSENDVKEICMQNKILEDKNIALNNQVKQFEAQILSTQENETKIQKFSEIIKKLQEQNETLISFKKKIMQKFLPDNVFSFKKEEDFEHSNFNYDSRLFSAINRLNEDNIILKQENEGLKEKIVSLQLEMQTMNKTLSKTDSLIYQIEELKRHNQELLTSKKKIIETLLPDFFENPNYISDNSNYINDIPVMLALVKFKEADKAKDFEIERMKDKLLEAQNHSINQSQQISQSITEKSNLQLQINDLKTRNSVLLDFKKQITQNLLDNYNKISLEYDRDGDHISNNELIQAFLQMKNNFNTKQQENVQLNQKINEIEKELNSSKSQLIYLKHNLSNLKNHLSNLKNNLQGISNVSKQVKNIISDFTEYQMQYFNFRSIPSINRSVKSFQVKLDQIQNQNQQMKNEKSMLLQFANANSLEEVSSSIKQNQILKTELQEILEINDENPGEIIKNLKFALNNASSVMNKLFETICSKQTHITFPLKSDISSNMISIMKDFKKEVEGNQIDIRYIMSKASHYGYTGNKVDEALHSIEEGIGSEREQIVTERMTHQLKDLENIQQQARVEFDKAKQRLNNKIKELRHLLTEEQEKRHQEGEENQEAIHKLEENRRQKNETIENLQKVKEELIRYISKSPYDINFLKRELTLIELRQLGFT